MTICTRPGCGVDFDPSTDDSRKGPCSHHPGAPVFHEGSKSWSCCRDTNKPVLEFDEFMLIGGCTTANEHTEVKQAKQTFEKERPNGDTGAAIKLDDQGRTAVPSITPMSSARVAAIERQNEQRQKKGESGSSTGADGEHIEEQDPTGADGVIIAIGTPCKRSGCKATFDGTQDRSGEKCTYHRGTPIFHEGSKGYSCCKRRVLEFDEFLTIEPCTEARSGHLFIGAVEKQKAGEGEVEDSADCRIDHYETPADVRVTVYAKGVEQDQSTITIKEDQVVFSLRLPALPTTPDRPRRFQKAMLPYAAIDAAASSYNITRFKIDLILVKEQRGESWPALERGEQALGYGLTFGRKLDA